MVRYRCTSVLLGFLLVSAAQSALAQPNAPPNEPPNGISVGRPKVFDNRTLTLMLENLSDTLRTLQVIDQKTIAAAFGFLQGSQTREFSSSLTIGTTPTPATTEDVTTNSGLVNSSGAALPDTTTRKTTENVGSVTPQIPALDAAANTIAGFNPQFGENASDLLSDQVNLSYQIFNLRMILERSLSDRIVSIDANNDETRLQAVLGFNVTIDPPRTAEDAVAVVEVTLIPQALGQGQSSGVSASEHRVSLVALMPQEKTYNASALSTKSNAFGGAAVAKMVHVGYNQRRRGQTFYIYRDADTIAYERMGSGSEHKVTFGWMFRPVLGQNAVTPGLRQLFAVVALPRKDAGDATDISQMVTARVRTYWKKYDRDTMTSFSPEHANRGARFRYFISATLGKPEIFDDSYVNGAIYEDIEVKPTERYQQALTPTIDTIRWEIVGPKTAVVSVKGNNFFTGTQVVLGGKTYVGNGDGLTLKSNQAFDLTTTLDALESGNAVVLGRYGAGIPLTDAAARHTGTLGPPVKPTLLFSRLGAALGGARELIACLTHVPVFNSPDETRIEPILSVNGVVVPPPYVYQPNCNTPGAALPGVAVIGMIPADAMKDGEGIVKLTWPFIPALTTSHRIVNPAAAIHVAPVGGQTVLFTHDGPIGFTLPPQAGATNPCWLLLEGTPPRNLPTPGCLTPGADTTRISDNAFTVKMSGTELPEKYVLVSPIGGLVTLELPKKKVPEPEKPIEVRQHDSVWIDVAVKSAAAIKEVDAATLKLPFRRVFDGKGDPDPKKLQVQLTRDVTARTGLVEVTFIDTANKAVSGVKVKVACTQCEKEGDK